MNYNWVGMKEISWDEIKDLYKNNRKKLTGIYFLHPDGTESQIPSDCTYGELTNHYDSGGTFGIEIPKVEIEFSDGAKATAPKVIDWSKCIDNIDDELTPDIWAAVEKFMTICAITPENKYDISSEVIQAVIQQLVDKFREVGCNFDFSSCSPLLLKAGEDNE